MLENGVDYAHNQTNYALIMHFFLLQLAFYYYPGVLMMQYVLNALFDGKFFSAFFIKYFPSRHFNCSFGNSFTLWDGVTELESLLQCGCLPRPRVATVAIFLLQHSSDCCSDLRTLKRLTTDELEPEASYKCNY